MSPRRGYLHHGIYVGDGRVIHYSGLSLRLWRGPVEESTLAHFADGRGVAVKTSRAAYAPEQIVARARSRLGENRYRLTSNNCEHFCEWCIRGESRSEQVERLIAAPRAALAGAAARVKRYLRVLSPTGVVGAVSH